jgi:hypothetical protein
MPFLFGKGRLWMPFLFDQHYLFPLTAQESPAHAESMEAATFSFSNAM